MKVVALLSALLILSVAAASPLWTHPELPDGPLQKKRLSSKKRDLADYLLPKTLMPTRYDVHLIPYLDINFPSPEKKFTFDGVVKIRVICEEDTSVIQMHAFEINIASTSMIKVTRIVPEEDVPVKGFRMSEPSDDRNFLFIDLDTPLLAYDPYDVEITYTGILNADMEGFYRSAYVENGETKYMAISMFAPTGARRAFPCFDEPDWKAAFLIKIAKHEGYSVQSNLMIEREDEDVPNLPNWKWVEFRLSMTMSTYLVAFSVNKFSYLGGGETAGVNYKLWARPNAVDTGAYANQMAPKAMRQMTFFTGHDYAVSKLEQLAVPDFVANAMENWGLITYRETALLYDETRASSSDKQRVGTIVTHEVAHQWFGNLATPRWWNHVWLSEGFATYFEYHATHKIESTWKLDEQFINTEMQTAFDADALETTHPILANVDSPSTINSVFDTISYNKGACIVRFMIKLIGEKNFRDGIFRYLEDHKYMNVDEDNLWHALKDYVPENLLPANMSFKELMDTWILQSGYPVITFERLYDDKRRAIVYQERFLNIPSETPLSEKWIVPITMTNRAEANFDDFTPDAWLTAPNMVLEDVADDDNWVVLNIQQMGFYRVNYDEQNWRMLARAINSTESLNKVHVINRAQLINDALALARAKYVSYPIALDTTNYLTHETEYLPWATAFFSLEYINDRLSAEPDSKKYFDMYLLARLMNIYNRLGGFAIPENEEHVSSLTRSLVLKWACQLDLKSCNDDAVAKFNEWKAKPNPDTDNPIQPNVKSVVYCTGMRFGNRTDWNFLFDRYINAFEAASEQSLILTSLGCSSSVEILQEYLALTIEEGSPIRTQDIVTVLTAVYSNPIGLDVTLDFIIKEFTSLQQKLGGLNSISDIFSGIATKLNTPEQRKKLQDFYDTNESILGGAAPAVLGALKSVDEHLQWHEDHKEIVVNYMLAKSDSTILLLSPILLLISVFLQYC